MCSAHGSTNQISDSAAQSICPACHHGIAPWTHAVFQTDSKLVFPVWIQVFRLPFGHFWAQEDDPLSLFCAHEKPRRIHLAVGERRMGAEIKRAPTQHRAPAVTTHLQRLQWRRPELVDHLDLQGLPDATDDLLLRATKQPQLVLCHAPLCLVRAPCRPHQRRSDKLHPSEQAWKPGGILRQVDAQVRIHVCEGLGSQVEAATPTGRPSEASGHQPNKWRVPQDLARDRPRTGLLLVRQQLMRGMPVV
mmetsp:Transcript_61629/g.155965  ORF Transcript_61629/g.155965 Transcript_61629/m.155965 type:complete len:248 (-) Transcript_61629:125-868(-)